MSSVVKLKPLSSPRHTQGPNRTQTSVFSHLIAAETVKRLKGAKEGDTRSCQPVQIIPELGF